MAVKITEDHCKTKKKNVKNKKRKIIHNRTVLKSLFNKMEYFLPRCYICLDIDIEKKI